MDGPESLTESIRRACARLPEVEQRLSHGAPTWFVRGKRTFVTVWPEGHHDQVFAQLWCAAPHGAQAELVAAEPHVYFRPPYVGHRGWLGLRLDRGVDADQLAELCEDAYRTVAPQNLVRRLDESAPPGA